MKIGGQTRLPSLELGCDKGKTAGECDSGYSCAYTSNLSWRGEKTPMPKEIDPAAVFERLFKASDAATSPRIIVPLRAHTVVSHLIAPASALS